jgi:hypothetical protein
MHHPAGKKLTRVHISARDFDKAFEFAEAAGKHDVASLEHEALLLAAIVCYGRPFSGNDKGKHAKADSELTGVDIPAVLGVDYDLHKRIVLVRHKAVAHSLSEHYPVSLMPPTVGEPGMRSVGFVSRSWHPVNEQIDLEAFARIAKAMAWKCRSMLLDSTRGAFAESLAPGAGETAQGKT